MTPEQLFCPACGQTRNVSRIENNTEVRKIYLGCRHALVIVNKNDQVNLSENPIEITIKDPIKELENALNEPDYFKAITYACTIFEHHGKQVLVWYFRSNGTPVDKEKIDYMELANIIVMLYTHNIIDDSIKVKIFKLQVFEIVSFIMGHLSRQLLENEKNLTTPLDMRLNVSNS